jgi:hypothetical protein
MVGVRIACNSRDVLDPRRRRGFAPALASALDRVCAAAAWLALPLALLLFAQWPLRDVVGAWSRDANDAAQWLFALYVALALRAATRARAHLAAGRLASGDLASADLASADLANADLASADLATRQREATPLGAVHVAGGHAHHDVRSRWRGRVDRFGEAVLVGPWALFVVVTGAAPTWRSVASLEAFPDTFHPLYFLIRCAAWLLALGVLLQALLDLAARRDPAR